MAQYKKVGNLKVRTDLSPEKQALVNQIAKNYVQQNKKIDAERRGNIARGGLGAAVSGASFLPILNIPGAGAAIGGAMYDLGQGIVEGDKALDLAKRAARGAAIGAVIPPAVKKIAATKAGQAVVKKLDKVAEKVAQNPTVQKAYDALMTDIKAFNPNKQTAYHGSPYDFSKFSNEAIGTGEGAQAHGLGHYAALDRDTAKAYAKNLSEGNKVIEYNGKIYKSNEEFKPNEYNYKMLSDVKTDGLEAAKNFYKEQEQWAREKLAKSNDKEWWEDTVKAVEGTNRLLDTVNPNLISDIRPDTGQLYKLSIPKDDVMLRESATFAEQPKKVQNAIREIIKENPDLAEFIDTRTKEELFDLTEKATGKNGKKIMQEIFDAELSGNENNVINAWNKWDKFETKNNISRDNFDPNVVYGYLRNYKRNTLDDVDRVFTNKTSNTNLYKYLEDERNLNKALTDKGIKGISYNGGIDGEARVIFNPDDIVIGRKYYNQPTLKDIYNKFINSGAIADAITNP